MLRFLAASDFLNLRKLLNRQIFNLSQRILSLKINTTLRFSDSTIFNLATQIVGPANEFASPGVSLRNFEEFLVTSRLSVVMIRLLFKG